MRIKSAFFLAVLLLMLLIIFKSNFFTIKQINIKSAKVSCIDEKSLKEKSNLFGQNFFLVDEKKVKEVIKKNFICIKDINLSKNLPDKIKLDIIGRIPAVSLYSIKNWEASASSLIENVATPSADLTDEPNLIDDEGIIFSKGDFQFLPKIYFFGDKPAGDYLAKALNILKSLKDLSLDNSHIFIFKNFFITSGNPKVVFDLDEDIDIQIASLQLIVQKAKIDSSKLMFIDLRFDKPVVKYAPKK